MAILIRMWRVPVFWLNAALIGLLVAGCGDDKSTDPEEGGGDSVRISESILSIPSSAYQIQSVSISRLTATLDVVYGGGCEEHSFRFYVDPNFRESNPVQTDAFLVHDSTDPCREVLSNTLNFNFAPLVEEHQLQYGSSGPILVHIYDRDDATTQPYSILVDP